MAKSFNSIKAGWSNPNKEVGKKKNFKDIKSADYDFGINESRINSFLKNSKEYFDNVEKETSSVNFKNAESKYSSNRDRLQTIGDEARTLRAYYNANKGKIDSESYNSMMEYLDNFDKNSSSVLDYYRNKADTFSKFETEAEFNDAVKLSELYDLPSAEVEKQMGFSRETYESDLEPLKAEYDKLNKDIQFYGRGDKSRFKSAKDYNDAKIRRDELKKQMTDLKGKDGIAYTTSSGQNITWSSLYNSKKYEEDFNALYNEMSANPDWAEHSKYKPTYDTSKAKGVFNAGDDDYERANFPKATVNGSQDIYYALQTDEKEKELFNYLAHTKGTEYALEWLKSNEDIYKERQSKQNIKYAQQMAKEVPILSDAIAVAGSVVAPFEYLGNVMMGNVGERTTSADMSSAIKGTRMEQIDWEVGEWDVFDFLYGTGTSMAESALAMTTFGGLGGVSLGLNAAAQSTNDALDRGMSKGEAFTSGVASGIFEGVFESWQIGAFSDLTKALKRADFRDIAKYIGKNMWNNAKEETLTEIANIAYDYLSNGDFSQYETTIRQYMNSGMSESDAKVKGAMELGGQVAEAMGSGALMGFGFGVGGGMKARHGIAQSGRAIKDAGETRNLVELGKSLGEGTESYEAANKIGDKSRALAIGRLMEIVGGDIPNANKVDMIKAFEEKGYNSREANLLVNKMTEQGLDSVANIRGMRSPTQTYNDVLNDPDSTISQRNEAYRGIGQNVTLNQFQRAMGKAVKNKSAVGSHKDLKGEQGKSPIQEENPIESKFESNIEGKDFNSKNDKVITSKKLVSSEKDNMKFEVTYDDGATDTVDANDINFGNEGEALVYSYVMDMNVPVGIAESLISGYKGNDSNSAGTYINGMREAFVFGKYNQEADLHSGAYASQLTEEQRNSIFKLGGIYAKEKAIADEKAIRGETKPSDIKKQEGKVHFEGDKLSLKSVQDVSLESLNALSKALGKDFHIYESYVDKNGKRVYKDANGEIKKAPNGFYRQLDGSIWIDLNAGNSGEGTIMYTVAHELTHFIKQWSPTKFKALADFLVEQYGKEGVSVHELVLAQQEKAKKNGREISYDVAFEEMVADSMETMLTDGKVIRELALKDKSLFDKIKSWIEDILRKLKKEYEHYSPETTEGQTLSKMKKTFEEAQRLFADALVDASDNFAIRGTDVGFIKQNMITETGKLAGVMDSTRTETEAMPKMVMDMSSGNGGKLFTDLATNYLIKGIGNGGAVKGYTVAQIREAIMKANGYNTKEIRNVQAFMKSMADFMNEAGVKYRFIGLKDVENAKLHYSYNADGSIKSVVLSAMVKNGDYPVNFDFSSICKKRVAMSKLINKLCDMGAMDKGTVNLSPKNIFEINKALKNEGFETACLGCFVESKRYNIQEWANSFIKKWNEAVLKVNPNATYFGFTDSKTNFDNLTSNQVFAIDKAAQTFLNKTGQERRNKAKAVYKEKANNGEALLEKLPKSAIEKIKKSQSLDDSMKDYFLSTNPKAFTLADVELLIDNEILAGKSISNKQKIGKMVESGEQFQHLLRPSDLLTERGITQLEQLPNFHGILYGHYGSGTPKLVQGFTPYNSEIALLSNKKGDKTLAEYLYSIAGVRMQSFSDFQIQNIFDYLQMIADLSARKLPAHAYTKEISFAKLLGMTGIKTNLSVMFDIDTSVDNAHAGLTKYNPAIHQGEYAKIVLEDEQGKWVYNIGDYATQKAYEDYAKMMGNKPVKRFLQSIGFADAVKLQTTEGYTKNCGIIGVGYSDAHILAMLDDSRIRYVIPYHSSSLPHEIKVATNIEKGTDYTSTQNTMKIKSITDKNGNAVEWSIKEAFKRLNSGKAVIEELNKHIKEDGWVVETKKAQNGHGTFDLYGDLSNTSNPRMTADNFMSWCAKNGSLPLFYQFADHNNYYKMLYDFNVYDNVTEEYAPQGAVTNTYPTGANIGENVVDGNFNDGFFKETVEHYMQVQNDFNARLDDTIDRVADDIVNNSMPDADFGILNSDRDDIVDADIGEREENSYYYGSEEDFYKDSKIYSYDFLVNQKAMKVLKLPMLSKIYTDKKIDRTRIIAEGKKNAIAQEGSKAGANDVVYVKNRYTNRMIEVNNQSIRHGIGGEKRYTITNARLGLIIGDIIRNGIPINELKPSVGAEGTYAMVSYAVSPENKPFLAIAHIDIISGKLVDFESVGTVHSLKGRTKKGSTAAINSAQGLSLDSLPFVASKISISQLLDFVNSVQQSILSDDVLNHFEETRKPEGTYYGEVLHSDRDDSSVSTRSLLANALEGAAQNDIEKNKLAQYKEKIALIEAEQNKLHELREKLFTKGIKGAERREIQEEATRTANRINTYDRQLFNLESTTALKNVLTREKNLARKRQKQKDAENLKAYKEKRDAEVDYLIKKNKNAIESRHKTVLKHKISDVLFKLDRLLNRGNKKRNVKQGLQQTVGSALNLGRMLFNSNIENEDIIRFGISALTEKEKIDVVQYQKLLAKKDAFYKELDELQSKNMEGADFDRHDYILLELDNINKQMRSLDKKLADVFERERARLNETEVTELVEKLAHDFAMLKNSTDEYIKKSYDEYKYNRLVTLAEALEGTTVKDMSKAQLQETYDAFTMIEHAVRTANKLFFEGKEADLKECVENVQTEVKDVADEKKDRNAFIYKALGKFSSFSWENLRPVDAFARLGSKTFEKLFWDAVEGLSKAGRMVAEAGDFIEKAREKYGYREWDLEVAPKTFITTDGKEFKPSLADMMSIYAYSFREQAIPHMTEGGFTYDTGRTYKDKTEGKNKKGQTKVHMMSDPYILSAADINNIISTLSEEQRAYVKECLPYFQVLATEGNKVSMVLHGIEIFKDKAYFPLKSSCDYLSSTEEVLNNAPTMATLQNIGMTKETTPGANNPIVLRGFDDVLSSHIEDMASYCSLALPISNLRKVFDNVGKTDADKPISTKALISSRFGDSAKKYFEQWITDLNGGIKSGGASGFFDNLFSRAKGVSVAANMSVIVQQYFAITRAMEIIDSKHFVAVNKETSSQDMKEYKELCKYSGIAIIKEIGGYDVGAKGRVKDYINDRQAHKDLKYIRKKTDDALMWGASAMDKLGWTTIWKAVKKEVAAEGGYTVGSEEFLKACAKRFNEVVTKTQVYDSVASRSGYMRSQSDAVKYATSFMSEPTVMVGRMYVRTIELGRAIGRKDKNAIKQAFSMFGRVALTTAVSQVLGKLAQSLIYGGRDDDEDEAFLEKWLSAFVENLHYDLKYLGLNNLPFARDVISIIDGWTVDRPDMTLIEDVVNAINKSVTDGCTLDEAINLVGTMGNILGIPVKNIVREFKSIGNFYDDVFVDDIKPTNLKGAIAEGFSGDDYSKVEKVFSFYESGDTKRVKDTVDTWVQEKFDSYKEEEDDSKKAKKKAIQSVRASVTSKYRDEYKNAFKNKDSKEMNEIRKFLYATGLWDSLSELDKLLKKWREDASEKKAN